MPKRTGESLNGLSGMGQKNTKKVGVTKTKKKKKKLQTRQSCIRALDKYFSLYVRNRDSDENGNITCVSCKKKFPRKSSHNCHFIDRAKRWYRWDERNCHAGCAGCNCYRPEYHMRHYTIFMITTYGEALVVEMMGNDNKIQKISTPDIREKLEFYKAKCKELGLK